MEEFKFALNPEDVSWREGRCYPYARNFTYFTLIDLLSRTFAIEESDAPEIVREKIESAGKIGANATLGRAYRD